MQNTGIKSEVVEEICRVARKYAVQRVILFGSRARGDYHRTSDIDLAVQGGNIDGFTVEVREETSTLLQYDVVNLEEKIQEKLLRSIQEEGIVLYEEV